MNKLQIEQLNRMRIAGYGPTKIARELGISVNTVSSYNRRHPVPPGAIRCANCGRLVPLTKGKRAKRFCSIECKTQWWNKRRYGDNRNVITSTCQFCGKEFKSYASDKRKYCSKTCFHDARRNRGINLPADNLSDCHRASQEFAR